MFSQSRHDHGWGERVWAEHPGGYQPEDWYLPPLNLHQRDVAVLLRPHRSCQCSLHPHVHWCPRVPFCPQRPAPKKVCSWNADPAWACPKQRPAGLGPQHITSVQSPPVLHTVLHQFLCWDGWAVEGPGRLPWPTLWPQWWDFLGPSCCWMNPRCNTGRDRHSSAPHPCHWHPPGSWILSHSHVAHFCILS